MTRWPLSFAAAWLVLLAHLAVAVAGEPLDRARPWRATGTILAQHPGHVLAMASGIEIALIAAPRQASDLARLSVTRALVRVEGLLYENSFRPYILIERIEESP